MTITREQQKQILIDTANHVISRDNTSPYSENLRELARIALASLEAEPIGAFHIADQQVGGTSDYIKDGEWPIDNGVIEVYAAPPAPVIPEECPEEIRDLMASHSDALFNDGDAQEIWNACRTAMQQAAPVELQERRKADSAEPIYQLFDAGWYDTNKSTYDTVTGTGMKGRIVYAAPQPLTNIESVEKVHE